MNASPGVRRSHDAIAGLSRAGQAQPDAARRRAPRRRLSPAADGDPLHRLRRHADLPRARGRGDHAGERRRGGARRTRTSRCARRGCCSGLPARGWAPTSRSRSGCPLGGGLGGGSSDAATTLLALNHLWGTGLPRERLLALALELGADVPVFVCGENALAEGIGERLTPLDLAAGLVSRADPAGGGADRPDFRP